MLSSRLALCSRPWIRRALLASVAASCLLLAPAVSQAFDADRDGASDDADAFPCDGASASVVFTPSQGKHGLLLFEDQWPSQGDLDFNDAAVSYNYIFELNAQGQVRSIRANYNVLAIGGLFNNGLGLQLPVQASSVLSVRQTIGQGAPTALSALPSDTLLTVDLLQNLRSVFGNQAGTINSDPSTATQAAVAMEVEIRFATPQTLDLGQAPFDLFLFRSSQRGHEIHQPQYAGTAQMDRSLFHSQDDRSSDARHFVDQDGLPFVLNFPTLVPWSREGVSIDHLYPRIVSFAASGGAQDRDFYVSGVDLEYAYGWSAPPLHQNDAPLAPGATYSIGDWIPVVPPSFVGPSDIPAEVGCIKEWGLAVQFGAVRNTFGYDAAFDSQGSVIVTGYTRRSLTGFVNQGAEDILVAKYNKMTGQLLWSRQMGGTGSETGRSIAVDSANNIYVVGETQSSLSGLPNAGLYDSFVTKLDSNGTVIWTRLIGGSGNDYATGVAVDASGSIFVGGGTTSALSAPAGSGPQSYLAKFDTSGTRQWLVQYRTDTSSADNYSYLSDIAVDSSGSVLAVGSERRSGQGVGDAEHPVVVKHRGTDGSALWTKHLSTHELVPSTGADSDLGVGHALGVITDSVGAVYVAGSIRPAPAAAWQSLALRLSSEGALSWSRQHTSTGIDIAQAVAVDAQNNPYFVGYSNETRPVDGALGGFDYYAWKVPGQGSEWRVIGGTTDDDEAFAAGVDSSAGLLFVVGNTGKVTGNPSAFQDAFYGFIARHNLTDGTQSSFQQTVDTKVLATSCAAQLSALPASTSGTYTIDPDGSGPIAPTDTYCNMTDQGGGWTLFARFAPNYSPPSFFGSANFGSVGGTPYSVDISKLGQFRQVMGKHLSLNQSKVWTFATPQAIQFNQSVSRCSENNGFQYQGWATVIALTGTGEDGCTQPMLEWNSGCGWQGRLSGPAVGTTLAYTGVCANLGGWDFSDYFYGFAQNVATACGAYYCPNSKWHEPANGSVTAGTQEWYVR